MTPPIISTPGYGPTYANQGYIIAGSRHKLACRCYACQAVRRRAREKMILRDLFHCG